MGAVVIFPSGARVADLVERARAALQPARAANDAREHFSRCALACELSLQAGDFVEAFQQIEDVLAADIGPDAPPDVLRLREQTAFDLTRRLLAERDARRLRCSSN